MLDDEIVRVVVNDLPDYRLIIFTSANGVDIFLGYLTEVGLPLAALDDAIVAAVGPRTASALEERGVTCDVVADEFVAEGLLATLEKRAAAPAGTRVLIPSARLARPVLPDALRASGARVTVLPVYDTVPEERLQVEAARIESADFITFTSSSTAQQFAALMDAAGGRRRPAARRAALRRGPLLHRPRHQRHAPRTGAARRRGGVRAHLRGARGGDRRLRRRRRLTPATLRRCA